MQLADRVDVVAEVDVRILAVHHVHLGERDVLPLRDDLCDELVGRLRVCMRLLLRRSERTELALHAADIRLVQVQVLDEVDLVCPAAQPAGEVRELAQLEEVVGLEDRDTVVEVEAVAGLDLLPDELQGLQLRNGDQLLLSTTAQVSASSSSRRGAPSRHERACEA